ncbi:MAG TPA: SAM-dependent methyltransferase [Acidimicrobiia bacterium]
MLVALGSERTDYVLLVKPQFEAGRAKVPRGGVVSDPRVHREVLTRVIEGLADAGLAIRAVMPSPRPGAKGNVEYLAWARQGKTPVSVSDLEAILP